MDEVTPKHFSAGTADKNRLTSSLILLVMNTNTEAGNFSRKDKTLRFPMFLNRGESTEGLRFTGR